MIETKRERSGSQRVPNLLFEILTPTQRLFWMNKARSYSNISEWYYGNISRQQAESLLILQEESAFLVRTSSMPGTF